MLHLAHQNIVMVTYNVAMVLSSSSQFDTAWKGSLRLIIQKIDIYHEFELKSFWLGENYATEALAS